MTKMDLDSAYREHRVNVYNWCRRIMLSDEDARDASQEVWVHLLGVIHQFRGESSFKTWLFHVTRSRVLMRIRKKHLDTVSIHDEDEKDGAYPLCDPRDQADSMVKWIELRSVIQRLPEGYREAFWLHCVEGYTHEEIAEFLGISSGTSKSQNHRAQKIMRKTLREKACGPFT